MIRRLKATYLRFFGNNTDLRTFIFRLTGVAPENISLYEQAFTHVSSVAGKTKLEVAKQSNERLEFLGDAILGAVVAEVVYCKYPFKDEGFLTELRSKIVNRDSLDGLAIKLNFDAYVKSRKDLNRGIPFKNMYGNALESFVGAMYLDVGFEKTRHFIVHRLLRYWIEVEKLAQQDNNFKSQLVEYAQEHRLALPHFEVVHERKNGNQKLYTIAASINYHVLGQGIDAVKKKAEQLAAEQAMNAIVAKTFTVAMLKVSAKKEIKPKELPELEELNTEVNTLNVEENKEIAIENTIEEQTPTEDTPKIEENPPTKE